MRHRRKTSESSFELFLDTVCNTFGGILFIAILIAIQIRQTENRTEPQTGAFSKRGQRFCSKYLEIVSEIFHFGMIVGSSLTIHEINRGSPTFYGTRILLA